MRIALTGASSTGKTSVTRELLLSAEAQALHLRSINVDSRGLLRKLGLGAINTVDSNEYRIFQAMYISQKILLEDMSNDYVTERSFADCLAYWRIHCSGIATSKENNLIEDLCFRLSRCYDVHYLFPTGFIPLERDGFRHVDEEYHLRYEKTLRVVLAEMSIVPVEMPHTSIAERVKYILGGLNG